MKKIVIVGKGGSGKDFLTTFLENKGYRKEIQYTSREKRIGEIEGKDYYFISKSDFISKIENDFFLYYEEYIGLYYGSSKDEYNTKDVFIKTPSLISSMSKEERENSIVVYLNTSLNERKKRMSKRKNNVDNYKRRLLSDEEDFKFFTDFDIEIKEDYFDCNKVLDIIKS